MHSMWLKSSNKFTKIQSETLLLTISTFLTYAGQSRADISLIMFICMYVLVKTNTCGAALLRLTYDFLPTNVLPIMPINKITFCAPVSMLSFFLSLNEVQ